VNTVGQGRGFEVDDNAAVILGADGTEDELPLQTKRSLARAICDRIAQAHRR
jgi:phosphopantothenoylcysteine decarboxylase / phosphopantothenate---cysteine ligase